MVFIANDGDPETESPSLRSVVPPGAAPVFLELEWDAWEGQPTSLSVERWLSMVENEGPSWETRPCNFCRPFSRAASSLTVAIPLASASIINFNGYGRPRSARAFCLYTSNHHEFMGFIRRRPFHGIKLPLEHG